MNDEDLLTEEEKDIFERLFNQFECMTISEQKTFLKMLLFEWLECLRNCKGRNKKYWQVQASTYEMMIHLFTSSSRISNMKEFLFNQVEEDYKNQFETNIKA